MLNRFGWRAGAAVLLGAIAVVLFRLEMSRRRRQGLQFAESLDEAGQPGVERLTSPAVRAATIINQPIQLAANRGTQHGSRANAAERPGRRLPRTLVLAVIAAFAAPAVATFVTMGGGASLSPSPAIAAEAVDTENGVYVLVHGEGFEPGSTVQLYWHHSDDDTVETTASETGEIDTLAPLPGSHHPVVTDANGMTDLVAYDGIEEVRLPVATTPQSGGGTGSAAAASVDRSKVNVNGSPYFLLGANYPWLNYGNDFGQNAWGSYGASANGDLAADFADMKARGVHVVRWWVFADGRAGINFAADGTPTGLQPVVYQDLDRAIAVAKQNNIYLNLVLFDVSLLTPGQQVNGVKLGGHSDLLTNTAKKNALMNNVISPLVTAYKDDASILSWEIMNEPEWAISDLPQSALNPAYVPVTMAQFWAFAASASAIIHFETPQQVTVGSAALKWNKVWTDGFAVNRGLPEMKLDFYQTHYYQWMDCCSTNSDELGVASWSPLVQKAADLQLDKPIVVGEVHTSAGSTTQMLDTIMANGYAGVWAWSYNSPATADHLNIDWSRYSPWEAAHAAAVRIPALVEGAVTPTSVPPTRAPATATRTPRATATRTPGASALAPVTFGRTTSDGFAHPVAPDYTAASLASLDEPGTLASLSVFVSATSPGARMRLGIYTADSLGEPGQLVAQTGSVTVAAGWNTVPVNTAAAVAPGKYWLTMQTDDPETSWRLLGGAATTEKIGFSAHPYGPMPQTFDGWLTGTRWSFAQYATIMAEPDAGAVDTEPTVGVPSNETVSPIYTSTATRTATAAAVATSTPTRTATPIALTSTPTRTLTPIAITNTPTRTATPAGGATATPTIGGGCVFNCGEPRFFCDTWTEGGVCDDYRIKGSGDTKMPFPVAGDAYSFDAFGSTQTGYNTSGHTAAGTGLRGFSTNEHFMTVIDDETFGMGVLRVQRPFDFAGREGHVHFEVDLKTSARRYVRFMLSPQLTKSATDDRMPEARRPANSFDLWFVNGTFAGHVVRNGSVVDDFFIDWPRYTGVENVRDDVDVYMTRTHIRVAINGTTYVNESIADVGYDRAYLYLVQASYNPCKDGECSELEQTFHWDNVAFDGPTLGKNSLTPAGQRDVVFNAFSAQSCTVRGVAASATSQITWGRWVSWTARFPDDGSSITVNDVSCEYDFTQNGSEVPRGFEIVKR